MSSRLRQSTVAATPTRRSTAAPTPGRRQNVVELPPYEQPAHPLNENAQRALAQLAHIHSLKKYDEDIKTAMAVVTECAGDINEALQQRDAGVRKRKAKRQNQETEDDAEDERIRAMDASLAEMREKVERMTQRLDESVRKMIDAKHGATHMSDTVKELTTEAGTAATQATTQGRSQRRRRRGNADEDGADEEYDDFTPTDPAGGPTQATQPLHDSFNAKFGRKRDKYQSHTLTQRYARDNAYRDFKRLVHDSLHPNEAGPPLAHEDTWFPDGDVPQPGITRRAARADDSDDDLQVAKETISTKCPLTLQEFKEPLTSRKCPHSFEASAITGMIDDPGNLHRVGSERGVRCPVPGCQSELTKHDLHVDQVLLRKIRRLQRANAMGDEDDDDDEGGRQNSARNAHEIESDDDDDDVDGGMDIDDLEATQKSVKPKLEKSTQAPRSTQTRNQVVELASEDEDDG
ncbi:hypothetical protein H2203_008001 [Taxawa tesnikishii (nom. ined.)]|nr:hypothetical protein H2203_008001 [Dothideales sp. JES 119]